MVIESLIIFTCSNAKIKQDCLDYMHTCVYSEEIVGTYDPVRQHILSIIERHEDCHNWEIEQRKEGKYAWEF